MTNTKEQDVIWRSYPDYPFVQANEFGEIRTIDHYITYKDGRKRLVKGHVLKQYATTSGYLQVEFNINGKHVGLRVHRVVATCFLPNPDNLPEINHKDNDPTNNKANNLEWCDHEYNISYREKYGISAAEAFGCPVFAVNLKTFEVLYFESQHEAARQLGVSQSNVYKVLKGLRKHAGGYWFTESESEITKEKIQEIKDNMPNGVFAVNLKTLEVLRFETQSEAARQLGVDSGNIGKVLKGRNKQTGGFWFCYADENAVENIRAKFGDEVANQLN